MERWLTVVAVLVASGFPAAGRAQTVGEVALGYAWQSTDGSKVSFANHFNLQDGVFVERLRLDLAKVFSGYERCELELAGFGAEPWQRGRLLMDWDREWSLRLDYSRRESSFSSSSFGLGVRTDDWTITRLAGSLTYRGWERAVLRLDTRDVRRQGGVTLPFYGLGTQYVARRDLDERLQEVGFTISTRDLPVTIVFQQDFARLHRRNRGSVGNDGRPAVDVDPDVLAIFTTPGEDESKVPTSHLSAVYRNDRVELVARGLHRRDHLDSIRNDEDSYDVAGGPGRAGFVDRLLGSADLQSTLGDLKLGLKIVDSVSVRLEGHYERSATDSALLGERIIRLSGPGGSIDLPLDASDLGFVERTDRGAALALEWNRGPIGASLRYHDGARKTGWRRGEEYAESRVTRDASGLSVVAFANLGRTVSVQLGWEEEDFSRYVFRIDPRTVERLWGRAVLRPLDGLEVAFSATREREDNPPAAAGLDGTHDSLGLSAAYSSNSGLFATIGVETLKLSSVVDTFFFQPQPARGESWYDSNVVAVAVRAGVPAGQHVRMSLGGVRVKDSGDSLPFTLDQLDARVELVDVAPVDLALFAGQWKYTLEHADADNYDARRFGFVVRRRF